MKYFSLILTLFIFSCISERDSKTEDDSLLFFLSKSDSLVLAYVNERRTDLISLNFYISVREKEMAADSLSAFEISVGSRPNIDSLIPNSYRRITLDDARSSYVFYYFLDQEPTEEMILELRKQNLLLDRGKMDPVGLNDFESWKVLISRNRIIEVIKRRY